MASSFDFLHAEMDLLRSRARDYPETSTVQIIDALALILQAIEKLYEAREVDK